MGMTFSGEFDGYALRASRTTTYDSRGGVNIVKNGGGFLHSVTFAQTDAAPTAGTVTIYDVADTSVYGDSTKILFSHTQTTAVFMPQTVILDIPFTDGLAVGHDLDIQDVGVTVSYK